MKMTLNKAALASVACMCFVVSPVLAGDELDDFLDLSLEELADIEITSVSKRSEKASEVAAAVHVITQEDIKRSGVTSVPEALRMAPGIQVARAGAHEWAITSRGFNAQFANKLLVLIDGRSVYTPLFSGVLWDVQDVMLEDVERIEVIRGPGGTIWGANAVNGVINIITKKASDTQGQFARTLHGNSEHSTAFRHGGKVDESTHYRAYGQYKRTNEFDTAARSGAEDNWQQARGGVRVDRDLKEYGTVMFDLAGYDGDEDNKLVIPATSAPFTRLLNDEWDVRGGHLNVQWSNEVGENSYSMQSYYDWAHRDTIGFVENTHTLDVDFNHSLSHFNRQEWMWGLGYRYVNTDIESTPLIAFSPEQREDNLLRAFIQDKIEILPEELFLTVGSKFEHNNYTGFEWQPRASVAWLVSDNQTVWGSATRAVRTPSRATHDLDVAFSALPTPLGTAIVRQLGNSSTDAEVVNAYELGYRAQPIENVTIDVATFFNDYERLVGDSRISPTLRSDSLFGAYPVIPFLVNDNASGEALGLEVSSNWQVSQDWLLTANYSFIDMKLNGGSTFVSSEANTPKHQFNVRSHYDIGHGWELDNAAYYVDELTPSGGQIDEYVRFDTQISWKSDDGLRLSLVGQNLLDSSHKEFSPFLYGQQIEVPRTVFARAAWQF